ncbi:MAG TPA: aliphatic sulfonate ABC transporter substrate-binding protein [Rhodocyclaceae bacterium]|nr:aliphatic sulfonate ABC transporter substrate-binding protein [Rhodocyclaceae bacterium]
MTTFSRRTFLQFSGAATAASLLPLRVQAADSKVVRIGYQKSSTLIALLKADGTLEKKLKPLGFEVSWNEFTSGLPLLEALNIGSIDFSADVADTVPVFALAAGAKLVYVAQEAPSPKAQAILVPTDSPIRTVADLKGKKIAVTKAAGSHYLLISALNKAGLSFKDITPAYLTPADGRAAFERGAVDAWVTWDPFVAAAQRQTQVRVIADGSNGVADYQRYYLASSAFADAQPKLVNLIYAELQHTGKWVKDNPEKAAAILAPIWGLDTATVTAANARRSYEVRPVVPTALREQQKIADTFYEAGLLPKPVSVFDAVVWKPQA